MKASQLILLICTSPPCLLQHTVCMSWWKYLGIKSQWYMWEW